MKSLLSMLLTVGLTLTVYPQNAVQTVWTTKAHPCYALSVAFSGDSRRLASSSPDGDIKVWDLATNAPVQSLYTFNATMLSVALSSNGQLVGAGGGDGASRMYRVSDGVQLWLAGPNGRWIINTVAFSPDDLWFADASWDSDIILRNISNTAGGRLFGHSSRVAEVAFSPDSTLLASAGSDDQAILWSIPGRSIFLSLTLPARATSVGFSPDGSVLATGGTDAVTRLWNVTNGAPILAITNTGGLVKFLGDGRYLMTLDDPNSFSYRFQIFRTSDGHYMGGYTNTAATCFAVARDGRYFAYGTTTGSVVLAYAPLIHEGFTREKRRTFMHWWGGSGYYQVQRRSKERGHKWRNWGQPTTTTTTRITDRPHFAYRVLSLPPP